MASVQPPPGFQIVPPPPEGFVLDPKDSMAIRQPDAAPAKPSAPKEQSEGQSADVSVLGDVAKSAGVGLAQGALGFATLPGNLESLARLGIDKGASVLGFEDPKLSESTILPTYNDAKGLVEKYTGQFYEPKTTAGEYARTVGEFAPTAAFGGPAVGATARAVNVLAPAVVSETAGQLTKGTAAEPWARAGGALAGGMLPNATMRVVTPAAPLAPDAVRAAHVARLENEGVDALTAGQRLGNRRIQGMEDAANLMPFGGARTSRLQEQSADQFTRAVLRRAGIDADRAEPGVIDAGFTRIGQEFDTLAARNTMRADPQFGNDLRTAVRDYFSIVPQSQRAPIVQDVVQDVLDTLQRTGGTISGEAYQALRSRLDSARRSTLARDPQLSGTLGDLRQALDGAMMRSASPADQAAWRQVRGQYRSMLAIEKALGGAGENTANGIISPSQLRTAVKGMNKRGYVRGHDDMAELAKAGEAILKPLRSSGTAERNLAIRNFENIGKIATLGGGGALAGGVLGVPLTVAGITAATLPGAAARTLMSRPVQRYLSNATLADALRSYDATRLPATARLPQASATLNGGIGPRYDENGNLIAGQ